MSLPRIYLRAPRRCPCERSRAIRGLRECRSIIGRMPPSGAEWMGALPRYDSL